DPRRLGRLVEQAVELAGRHWLAAAVAWEKPTVLQRHFRLVTRWARLSPFGQEIERLSRQPDGSILAALRLLHANDLLRAVDVFDLQPDHLASTQAAAIAETEQNARLEATGDGQQALGLVRAHHQRDLLGFTDVIDLGGKVQSPQRHAQQETQPG